MASCGEKHYKTEEEHHGTPNEVDVQSSGLNIDGTAAGEETVDEHDSAEDEEDLCARRAS